ncbi:MAG: VWA domain-containing protein [Brevinematales bacterium]|nr:VWA domain-containing protein [Brevinematales bacterium]
MIFASPWFLLFLAAIPVYLVFKYRGTKLGRMNMTPTMLYSSNSLLSRRTTAIGRLFDIIGDILFCTALAFFIVALARPLGGEEISNERNFGIDIVLAIDVSGSMMFVDRIPSGIPYRDVLGTRIYYDQNHTLVGLNRLNSAKKVISGYINKQNFNRIGIVTFAGYSFTRCPLTLDKSMLLKIISDLNFDPKNDGTAIGMGLATAVNRLRKSDAKSKVIILLTDGVNNAGWIDPATAATIARDMGIRIYTIGVGNPHGYLAPADFASMNEYYLQTEVGFDEGVLRKIAEITGGKFYKAEDPDSLKEIYDDIDKLEKSKIDIKIRTLFKENFMIFLTVGFILFASYIVFTSFVIKIP